MSEKPTRVFIVDDHRMVREWLANLLRLERDFRVVGEAEDEPSALAAMAAQPPDIAVVDLSLKKGSGLELIRALRAQVPTVAIVVLSMHEELTDVERAFRAGAAGYVMKQESTGQIVAAIREVRAGGIFVNPALRSLLAARLTSRGRERSGLVEHLSDRELEVLRRLGGGESTREIGAALGVSQKTVQTYCARIKEKLGLDDAQELTRYAYQFHDRRRGQ